jgi:hypothetical protein
MVQKINVHEKDTYTKIKSSPNPMHPLQGFLLPDVWTMPTWEFAKAPMLAPNLDVVPTHIHVQNNLNMCLNM